AFARACGGRSDVRLVICGDGPLRTELEQLAVTLGISSRVSLAGLVPNERVADYVAAADLFVLPSLLQALPTVAVEALGSGTPVLSADHPGGVELHDVFGADVTVVPQQNAGALADALASFLQHPRRATAETQRTIAERFSPTAVIGAFDRI